MKLITAIIKPFKLQDVRERLSAMGVQAMTATEVKVLLDGRRATPSFIMAPSTK